MSRTGCPKSELILTDEEREQLLRWSRRPTSAQALALRSRIILGCAEGLDNKSVAARSSTNRPSEATSSKPASTPAASPTPEHRTPPTLPPDVSIHRRTRPCNEPIDVARIHARSQRGPAGVPAGRTVHIANSLTGERLARRYEFARQASGHQHHLAGHRVGLREFQRASGLDERESRGDLRREGAGGKPLEHLRQVVTQAAVEARGAAVTGP
ncbi:hypothetical protein SAMN05216281_101258 [Cryobacterium luteum]|nr:hypothetical protein SAMN05216281_101258 [Cryobacterium luteum]